MATQLPTTTELYMTPEDAARRLGSRGAPLSIRRVLNFVTDAQEFQEGHIRRSRQMDPVTHREGSVLLARDVAALVKLRAKRAALLGSPAKLSAAPLPAGLSAPVAPTALANVYTAAAAAAQLPAPVEKKWLTLAEAAAQSSGLPQRALKGLVAAGAIRGVDVGTAKRPRYMIHVEELDSFRGACLKV